MEFYLGGGYWVSSKEEGRDTETEKEKEKERQAKRKGLKRSLPAA